MNLMAPWDTDGLPVISWVNPGSTYNHVVRIAKATLAVANKTETNNREGGSKRAPHTWHTLQALRAMKWSGRSSRLARRTSVLEHMGHRRV